MRWKNNTPLGYRKNNTPFLSLINSLIDMPSRNRSKTKSSGDNNSGNTIFRLDNKKRQRKKSLLSINEYTFNR